MLNCRLILCFLCMGFWSAGKAQTLDPDSLKLAIQQMETPAEKLIAYKKICDYYYTEKPAQILAYALPAAELAHKLNRFKEEAMFLTFAGHSHYFTSKYAEALEYYFKALSIREKLSDKQDLAKSYNSIAIIFQFQENHPKALEYFEKALALNSDLKNCNRAVSLNNMGWSYDQSGQDSLADRYYREAINLSMICRDTLTAAYSFNGLGVLLYDNRKFPEALYYFKRSLEISLPLNDYFLQSWNYNYLSMIHVDLGLVEDGLMEAKEALRLSQKIGDKTQIEKAWYNLYRISALKKEESYALTYLQNYLNTHDSLTAERQKKKLWVLQYEKEAEKRKVLDIALTEEKKNSLAIKEQQTLLMVLLGLFMALILFVAFRLQKERDLRRVAKGLFDQKNDELNQQQEELHMQNESILSQKDMLEKQNEEIKNQRRQLMRQHAELTQSQIKLEKANQQLKEAHKEVELLARERGRQLTTAKEELDMFTQRAFVDFKGPLSSLRGLAYTGKKVSVTDDGKRLFREVEITAERMENLFAKLMAVYYINHHVTCSVETTFREIFDKCREALHGSLAEKQYSFEVRGNMTSATITTDPELWKQALLCVWENALQHSGRNEDLAIVVEPNINRGVLSISFSDNGTGILPEIEPRIFEMYYRGSDKSGGNGLGLYIAQKAMEKMDGSISYEGLHGCSFVLSAPVSLR